MIVDGTFISLPSPPSPLQALAEYNETNAVMDLVLFEDAVKHVCRISRIISSPGAPASSALRLVLHLCL